MTANVRMVVDEIVYTLLIIFETKIALIFPCKHRKHAHLMGLLTGVMKIGSCALNTAYVKTYLCDLVVSPNLFRRCSRVIKLS